MAFFCAASREIRPLPDSPSRTKQIDLLLKGSNAGYEEPNRRGLNMNANAVGNEWSREGTGESGINRASNAIVIY